MWCSKCKKETASVPNQAADGVCCAACGEARFASNATDETIRQARDIIAKWSSSDLLDQISSLPEIPELPAPRNVTTEKSDSVRAQTEPNPEPAIASGKNASGESPDDQQSALQKPQFVDEVQVAKPHINITLTSAETPLQSSNEDDSSRDLNVEVAPEQPTTKKPRKQQARKPQPRVQRNRRRMDSVAKEEGSMPMSRKLRIDSPGDEHMDAPEQPQKNVAGGKIQSNSKAGRRHRIDSGTPVSETLDTGSRRSRTQSGRRERRYIDDPHESVARGPHFEVTPQRRSNLTSITGQFLAYLGVLGLTIGTAMVIYGHFGGYSEYTPTGWLVTTVAQMMLFLGVINLVSGGMEQTNDDVSQRIDYLGAQLMRIEQVTEEALRGPKISPRRYMDPNAPIEEEEQAVVYDD